MNPEESKALVQDFYDQWNAGTIDFERLVHPDIANHQPDRDPEVGLDRFRQAIEGVTAAVPDSHWTTLRPHIYRIADGRIAEHWVVRDDLGMMLQTGAIGRA